ncbi:MAG: glucan biosynthesis protein [Halothiobacillaceae bacterium]|nr:glucan biosynthesis protein [Halothiobacillaceae bacterium]
MNKFQLRHLTLTLLLGLAALPVSAIEHADIDLKAKALAAQPFSPPKNYPALTALTYDDMLALRYRTAKSPWLEDGRFYLQFFHLGNFNTHPVKINLVENAQTRPWTYDKSMFEWPDKFHGNPGVIPEDLGFAGLRVHAPMHPGAMPEEFLLFLGASYFRSRGDGEWYGQSARALAIDTVLKKEEFPVFTEFWVERPQKGDKSIRIHALIDSESLSGAMTMDATPGDASVMRVQMTLHLRKSVQRLGLAPLTSMFEHGEMSLNLHGDFRPEVHDTDGLLIETATGERIWRPLSNPGVLLDNAFRMNAPRGFGLFQRDRLWDHYQDIGARYPNRTNLWIEPEGSWGKGSIALIQIPTNNEYMDNVVAFWTPEKPAQAGDTLRYAYRMTWHGHPQRKADLWMVRDTRIGRGDIFNGEQATRFVIDFEPGATPCKAAAAQPVPHIQTSSSTKIVENHIDCRPDGGWRAAFNVVTPKQGAQDLSLLLLEDDKPVSETWSYTFQPEREMRP